MSAIFGIRNFFRRFAARCLFPLPGAYVPGSILAPLRGSGPGHHEPSLDKSTLNCRSVLQVPSAITSKCLVPLNQNVANADHLRSDSTCSKSRFTSQSRLILRLVVAEVEAEVGLGFCAANLHRQLRPCAVFAEKRVDGFQQNGLETGRHVRELGL